MEMREIIKILEATNINFIDPATKYADQAKVWKFKRVGTLDQFVIVRTMIPDNIAQGVQEFFVMEDKSPIATFFLSPFNNLNGRQVWYAAVTPSKRGQGIGRRFYMWLLKKKIVLLSDIERSRNGTAVWFWLSKQPHVTVTALPIDNTFDDEHTISDDIWRENDKWIFVARYN